MQYKFVRNTIYLMFVSTRAIDNDLYSKIVVFAIEVVLERLRVFQIVTGIIDETDERLAIGMRLVAIDINNELFTNFCIAKHFVCHFCFYDNFLFLQKKVDA